MKVAAEADPFHQNAQEIEKGNGNQGSSPASMRQAEQKASNSSRYPYSTSLLFVAR